MLRNGVRQGIKDGRYSRGNDSQGNKDRWLGSSGSQVDLKGSALLMSARNSRGYRPGSSLSRKALGKSFGMSKSGIGIQGRPFNKSAGGGGRGGRLPDFGYSNPATPREARRRASGSRDGSSLPAVTSPTRPFTAGSGGSALSQVQPADEDGVIFAVSAKHPGIPFVFRSQTARMVSPERLNLDRRNLTICPILEGEEQLRLLNFENNNIVRISNLTYLPNLIFLDLYNNQIKEISGLESLGTLRVLMLGKNYIRKIERLESLVKLDVLDLHSNRIAKIQNLSHLRDLRVLNLAGNQIDVMENLEGLTSLTELNLRRNGIHTVHGLENSHNLHRVFLSDNRIPSFSRLESLFRLKSLNELTVDGNEVAGKRYYREYLVDRIKTLRTLDMRRVTDEERRVAGMVVRNDEKLEKQRREHLKAEREHTLSAIKSSWSHRHRRSSTKDRKTPPSTSIGPAPKGFYEITDKTKLALYGNALEQISTDQRTFPERDKIETLEVEFYEMSRILEYLPKLRRFTNVQKLVLRNNDFRTLAQLDPLASCNLRSLEVSDNKICATSLLRPYAILKLPSLTELNGSKITKDEKENAKKMFGPVLSAPMKHLNEILQKRKDKQVATFKETSKSRKIARYYVDKLMHEVLVIDKRINKLESVWPSIVSSIVRSTLTELYPYEYTQKHATRAPKQEGKVNDRLWRTVPVPHIS